MNRAMKTPETQADFDAYLASAEFERRCVDLFRRFEAGESMAAADAAEVIRLPWPVFRHVFAAYLTLEHAEATVAAEAIKATKH